MIESFYGLSLDPEAESLIARRARSAIPRLTGPGLYLLRPVEDTLDISTKSAEVLTESEATQELRDLDQRLATLLQDYDEESEARAEDIVAVEQVIRRRKEVVRRLSALRNAARGR